MTIEVKDDIEAYMVLNRIVFNSNVLKAEFENKEYLFSKTEKSKLPKMFLKDSFGKEAISIK